MTTIRRGTVWLFDLRPTIGSEQDKVRPCVIVQRDSANERSPTTIACPLKNARGGKASLLNVLVRAPEGGVSRDSLVICNQVRVLDRLRLRGEMLGILTPNTMAQIDEALRVILDLGDD